MMNNVKIKIKLPLLLVGFAIIAAAAVGFISQRLAGDALQDAALQKLTAVKDGHGAELERYLASIKSDLVTQAENPAVINALSELTPAFQAFGAGAEQTLQKLYITDNPNPAGKKDNYDAAPDNSPYTNVHRKYHPYFHKFQQERDYYDFFLIDTKGDVVYTVFKELDFASNVENGRWARTEFSSLVRKALAARRGEAFFTDFAPYEPSANVPASFMAAPVFGANGNIIGAVAFQMPIGRLNTIMQQNSGMGETGETFIVGKDGTMRSDSRFSKESTILAKKIESAGVKSALAGKSGSGIFTGSDGKTIASAYSPITFMGVSWGVVAEEELGEIESAIDAMSRLLLMVVIGLSAVLAVVGFLAALGLVNPIVQMNQAMAILAQGRTDTDIPARDRGDEIGEMSLAVQVFKDNIIQNKRLEAEQEARDKRAVEDRRAAMRGLADEFQQKVGSVIQSLSAAATELQSSASSMSTIAQQTSSQATAVSSSADQATGNVQTVAAAAEELSASISEIRRQVSGSADTAKRGVQHAERTNSTIQGLVEATGKISDVVNLITSIASQTNLLALNATIEAARAGEAGKGFAVVASEVKNLANQTAKATEEISRYIGSIQTATKDSVTALREIADIIGQIDTASTTINHSVEEQSNATMEISRSVQQAAASTADVSQTITNVNEASRETGNAAAQVLEAAQRMAQETEMLNHEVGTFLAQIRS